MSSPPPALARTCRTRDRVLIALAGLTEQQQGRPPTRAEIAAAVHIPYAGQVGYHLLTLQAAGLVANRGGTRGMYITAEGRAYLASLPLGGDR